MELGWAIAAFLCLWIRNPYYWLGVAIAPSVMSLMAGGLHIHEVLVGRNLAPYNAGIIVPDLLVPLTMLGLLRYHFRLTRSGSQPTNSC